MSINKNENEKNIHNRKDINISNNIMNNIKKRSKIKLNEIYQFEDNNFNNDILQTKSKTIINSNNNNEASLLKEKDKKIEVLKEQCESLQKQLLIKTEYIIKKEKEEDNFHKANNKNFKNIKLDYSNLNTSTNFPIKSEIKKIWEELALMSILDNFIDYENKPECIFFFVTEMIIILEKLIDNICKDIYEKLSLSLNIKNDKKFLYDIEQTSRPLIKENLNKIFISTEQKPFITKFIDLYKNSLKIKFGKIQIDNITNTNDFLLMIQKIKEIILFSKFNDPPLFFNIEPNIKLRKCEKIYINNEMNKKNFLIINDNGLQNVNGIILLKSPIMKNGFPINNDLKTIIMLDENNNNNNNYINKKESDIHNLNYIMDKNFSFSGKNNYDLFFDFDFKGNFDDNNVKYKSRDINLNEFDISSNNKTIKEDNNKKISNNINIVNENDNQKKEYRNEQNTDISKLDLNNINKKYSYNLADNYENEINKENENNMTSNFSFISENINIKSEYNQNTERTLNQKIVSSDSRGDIKPALSERNIIKGNKIKDSYSKYKKKKTSKKIKKINIKKNKIKINISKINNNIKFSKHNINNKRNQKENFIFFYNQKLPLLLNKNNIELNRLKSTNYEKYKKKKISNNKTNNYKFVNFSTEICNKDLNYGFNNINNDLIIKNGTAKELVELKNKKPKDYLKITAKNQKKMIIDKHKTQIKDLRYIKNNNNKNINKMNNLKCYSISKIKTSKTNDINKIKYSNNIKNILGSVLNNNMIKNENVLLSNKSNNIKKKDNFNMYKIGYLKKNIKSTSRKNILASPKDKRNKKIFTHRNYNNTFALPKNDVDKKIQNDWGGSKNNNYLKKNRMQGINTGYKIKNLNINYFNIIQPNELFFNQHSSRSNSKKQIINKSKLIIFNNNSNLKFKNLLSQSNNKNKMDLTTTKVKNSLYFITDYNSNNINTNKKAKYNKKQHNSHHNNGSCTGSSFSHSKFEGISTINFYKDKKGKQLIKQKMHGKDLNSINFFETKHKNSNNNIFKNNNRGAQISFIKISKKINNTKRDISNGRKYLSKIVK